MRTVSEPRVRVKHESSDHEGEELRSAADHSSTVRTRCTSVGQCNAAHYAILLDTLFNQFTQLNNLAVKMQNG